MLEMFIHGFRACDFWACTRVVSRIILNTTYGYAWHHAFAKKVEILYTATVSITTTPTSDNYQFLSCGFDFTIEFGCTNCSPLNVGSFGIISQPWISWLVCVWCVCVCVCSTWDILGWRMSCAHDMISQRESHDIRTSDRKRADDYTIELPILAHTS